MKIVNKIGIVVLTAVCSTSLFAQQQEISTENEAITAQPTAIEKIVAEKTKPTSLIDLWLNVGYSAFYDGMPNTSVPGGYGAGLGLGYSLEASAFRMRAGVEFNWLNSTTNLTTAFQASRPMTAPYSTMTYNYHIFELSEARNIGYVNVPLLFGAQFGNYYFLVGPKVGINVMADYNSKAIYHVTAQDDEFIDHLSGMPNHFLATQEGAKGAGKLNFTIPNVSIAAEFGIDLDKWLQYIPEAPKKVKKGEKPKKEFKECLHYRLGFFAEYGLLNTNDFDKNLANNGQIPMFEEPQNPAITSLNTLLGSSDFGMDEEIKAKHNPLFVGMKFVVQFELPKKQPKPAPKPKPQPVVKPKPQPILPTMKCVLLNAETNERVSNATVEIFSQDTSERLYSGACDSVGGFATELNSGTYASRISAPGYYTYTNPIMFIKDTITIFMQPLGQHLTITLRNVFFATNKTNILPESEPSLEDLFEFLTINDQIRVRIIGHTDAIGTDKDNQILSEGRAKSVMEDMIARGIEPERLEYEGRGESEPVADNETEEGRALNRRVVVEILQAEDGVIIDIPDNLK